MLAMLLAQLPRDLAVEEAYVTMLNEMAATDDDEETQLLEEEREADNSKEKKARQR